MQPQTTPQVRAFPPPGLDTGNADDVDWDADKGDVSNEAPGDPDPRAKAAESLGAEDAASSAYKGAARLSGRVMGRRVCRVVTLGMDGGFACRCRCLFFLRLALAALDHHVLARRLS